MSFGRSFWEWCRRIARSFANTVERVWNKTKKAIQSVWSSHTEQMKTNPVYRRQVAVALTTVTTAVAIPVAPVTPLLAIFIVIPAMLYLAWYRITWNGFSGPRPELT